MTTKGYSSYHGRMSGRKIALIVVLALVLVGAVAYLVLQNYVVYDESGNAKIEVPFFQKKEKKEQQQDNDAADGPGERDDLVDTVEPEHPHVKVAALHGVRLPDDCLWWGANYIMDTLAPEDMVLAVKRTTGGITYGTSVATPAGVVVETGRPLDCLKTLLGSGRYTVGQIVCFQDSAYSRAKPDAALVREDGALWYDGEGQSWLDPTSAETLGYITALVKECGELGFREVLLDRFCYPGGDTAGIANGAEDRVQVLTDFAEKLRGALPEGVALSVVVRDTESLSVAQMAELFDRLYVPAERAAAVKAALPEGYDPETRVVVMAAEAQSGSYVVVK